MTEVLESPGESPSASLTETDKGVKICWAIVEFFSATGPFILASDRYQLLIIRKEHSYGGHIEREEDRGQGCCIKESRDIRISSGSTLR